MLTLREVNEEAGSNPNLRIITYKPVRDFTEHCNVCGERLGGNNSVVLPFKCSCGTWRYVDGHFEIIIEPRPIVRM